MIQVTLAQYLDLDHEAEQGTRERLPDFFKLLDELAEFFDQISRSTRNTQQATIDDRFVELCLFHDARRFWLSGCATWVRQHLTECFPAMRAALEAAAYARRISLNPGLNQVWLSRDQRQKEFDAAFRDGGIEQQLFPEKDRLVRKLWWLFDTASMYGVHANHERLAFSLEEIGNDDGEPQGTPFYFGAPDQASMRQVGAFCLDVGVRIIQVFERVLEDVTGQAVWTPKWGTLEARVLQFATAELSRWKEEAAKREVGE